MLAFRDGLELWILKCHAVPNIGDANYNCIKHSLSLKISEPRILSREWPRSLVWDEGLRLIFYCEGEGASGNPKLYQTLDHKPG